MARKKNDGQGDPRPRIMAFVKEFLTTHEYAPTIEEIAAGAQVGSKSTTQYHVDQLVSAGLMKRGKRQARTLAINTHECPGCHNQVRNDYAYCPTCGWEQTPG